MVGEGNCRPISINKSLRHIPEIADDEHTCRPVTESEESFG